jgi:hypothetical protein
MTSSISSKRGRVLTVGILCVILSTLPAVAAPSAGQASEGPHWTISKVLREMVDAWVGFLMPGSVSNAKMTAESGTGVGTGDAGPIGGSGLGTAPTDPIGGGVEGQSGTSSGSGDSGPVGG